MEQLRDQTKHITRPDSNRRHHLREDQSSRPIGSQREKTCAWSAEGQERLQRAGEPGAGQGSGGAGI